MACLLGVPVLAFVGVERDQSSQNDNKTKGCVRRIRKKKKKWISISLILDFIILLSFSLSLAFVVDVMSSPLSQSLKCIHIYKTSCSSAIFIYHLLYLPSSPLPPPHPPPLTPPPFTYLRLHPSFLSPYTSHTLLTQEKYLASFFSSTY